MPISLDIWDSYGGRDAESSFARDEDGNFIRRVQATRDQLDQKIDIVIDGIIVKDMPLATIVKDAQGAQVFDLDGYPKVRKTTIYDAASELVRRGEWTKDELERRIPVLCHREHLNPVAVCRVCSVHVVRPKRAKAGKLMPDEKLAPACHFEIQKGMVVTTRCGPNPAGPNPTGRDFTAEVLESIKVLGEYLVADHYKPDDTRRKIFTNELKSVADSLDIAESRLGMPSRNFDRNAERHAKSRPSIPLPVVAGDGYRSMSELPESGISPGLPYSSRTVAVDHDRCILCDRCVRSCNEVRPFKVLGHTGKGYLTRISFDLDENMNDSSCVQCGECMNSCPTGALQLNRRIVPIALRKELNLFDESDPFLQELENPKTNINSKAVIEHPVTGKKATGFLSAEEMQALKFEYVPKDTPILATFQPFRDVPLSYLRWNEGAVRYRKLNEGEEICTQGHYANTAYFIKSGDFGIWKRPEDSSGKKKKAQTDDPGVKSPFSLNPSFTLIGELAPLSNQPRAATVRVVSKEAEVYEVTRNILDMAQRTESARDVLGILYTRNALFSCLQRQSDDPSEPTLFEGLSGKESSELVKFLIEGLHDTEREEQDKKDKAEKEKKDRERADKEREKAGKPPAKPPDTSGPPPATDREGRKIVYPLTDPDAYQARATLRRCSKDEKIVIEGEKARDFYIIRYGTVKVSVQVEDREVVVAKQSDNQYFGEIALMEDGRRTATITALDSVELVRIPKLLFAEMLKKYPSIRDRFEKSKQLRLARSSTAKPVVKNYLSDYLNQGLYQGRNLLVLDLHSCTRCDECTRACADSHGDKYSRLLREGMRFGKFLVAASCRSCYKPYCMDGCPVDAIHRSGTELQIKIDDHCIRCGLCERNCPYGAIQIPDKTEVDQRITIADKAINCDKCHDLVPEGADPFCVAACPHEAAFRMSGTELYEKVTGQKI